MEFTVDGRFCRKSRPDPVQKEFKMKTLSPACSKSFEASATIAAAYLDACDAGALEVRLDPEYYQACASLLQKLFTLFTPDAFAALLLASPAAREVAESLLPISQPELFGPLSEGPKGRGGC